MSNDSSLSKSQQQLLKQFKKQIHSDSDRTDSHAQTKSNAEKSKAQKNNSVDTQTIEDESQLFSKAMQGVEKIKDHNLAQPENTTKQKPNDVTKQSHMPTLFFWGIVLEYGLMVKRRKLTKGNARCSVAVDERFFVFITHSDATKQKLIGFDT